jgi:uncharacterized protein
MNPLKIIKKYYKPKSKSYHFLIEHSRMVTKKALKVAEKVKRLNPNFDFIREASMLHDIGILLVSEPKIGCYGGKLYVCHGILGREILEKEGLLRHALVCERHVGVGITKKDVLENNLPLPKRDMLPVSIEEKIICFADKFYAKIKNTSYENSPEEIIKNLAPFGQDKVERFESWLKFFG